jgi:putative ABC transport system substrate-binding protein
MRRRQFIARLCGAAASSLWPLAGRAQQADGARRIAVLMAMAATDAEAKRRVRALQEGLRALGWDEGRNIRIDYRWAPGDAAELQAKAAETVAAAPDLIVANSTPVLAALKKEGGSRPIVFTLVTDPVGDGFVASLARPGGNATGFSTVEFSIGGKWLETLRQVAPSVRRVGVLFNPKTAPFAPLFLRPIEAAAATLAIEAVALPAQDGAAIERVITAFARAANAGLIALPDLSMTNERDLIIALAASHRLPAIYPYRLFAASGGLLSYGSDVADIYRRVAAYVDRILKGANPAELPVQTPAKYELVVNAKTAHALGLALPSMLLARADEVIE